MNEHAKLWLEALESGRYRQTRGVLEDADGNCCLGLACRVYMEAGNDLLTEGPVLAVDAQLGREGFVLFAGEAINLPGVVRIWLGLRTAVGGYRDESGDRHNLAKANEAGKTFHEIAQIIRDHEADLFE